MDDWDAKKKWSRKNLNAHRKGKITLSNFTSSRQSGFTNYDLKISETK